MSMVKWNVQTTGIEGLHIIEPAIWRDSRGSFCEVFHRREFGELGLPGDFVQENQSVSHRGVLRGLHFQTQHPQGKLVRVVSGRVWDVAVDLRPESPTFGRSFATELSAENGRIIYIPPRFAHGFLSLEEPTLLVYLCTDYYFPQHDSGIRWDDPDLRVDWNFARLGIEKPILSAKDTQLPSFQDFLNSGVYR